MIKLRMTCNKDCDLLFNWANDELVRKNSFNTTYITYEEHSKWFLEMIKSKDILAYIMEYDGVPVGQVRLKITNNQSIVSYSISKKYRGKKFGYKIIKLVEQELYKVREVNKIIAHVKIDNIGSRKIFTKFNYKEQILDNEVVYFKLI